MAKANPFLFIENVRAEVKKVTWPTRRETLVTTGMVLLMVLFAAIFFLLADQTISWVLKLILNVGR